MLSDGELDEGSNWEAILFAPQHRLDNLKIRHPRSGRDRSRQQPGQEAETVLSRILVKPAIGLFRRVLFVKKLHGLSVRRQIPFRFQRRHAPGSSRSDRLLVMPVLHIACCKHTWQRGARVGRHDVAFLLFSSVNNCSRLTSV